MVAHNVKRYDPRGYDSDALDRQLMTSDGIEMIAWSHNVRRLVTRWERHVDNFLGMLRLACARILLRHL